MAVWAQTIKVSTEDERKEDSVSQTAQIDLVSKAPLDEKGDAPPIDAAIGTKFTAVGTIPSGSSPLKLDRPSASPFSSTPNDVNSKSFSSGAYAFMPSLPNNTMGDGQVWSATFWGSVTTPGTAQTLFSKWTEGVSHEFEVGLAAGLLRVRVGDASTGVRATLTMSVGPISLQWFFFAAVYDGTSLKGSFNGNAFETVLGGAGAAGAGNDYVIGARSDGSNAMDGNLAQVHLYKVAIGLDVVKHLYNNGKGRNLDGTSAGSRSGVVGPKSGR